MFFGDLFGLIYFHAHGNDRHSLEVNIEFITNLSIGDQRVQNHPNSLRQLNSRNTFNCLWKKRGGASGSCSSGG